MTAEIKHEGEISGQRRALLYGGVGVAAIAAGGLSAWMKFRVGETKSGVEDEVWSASFESLKGPELSMSTLKGKPLLLNFWATWCPPCVEEFPLIDGFYRQHGDKFNVLGLAIDQRAPVEKFVGRIPVTFPIAFGGLAGTDIGRKLGNESGGLPFTAVFHSSGALLERKIGQIAPADLQRWTSAITN